MEVKNELDGFVAAVTGESGLQFYSLCILPFPSRFENYSDNRKLNIRFLFQAHEREVTRLQHDIDVAREQKDIALKRVKLVLLLTAFMIFECRSSEVSLEAGNRRIPPATSQVIAAYYFDKLHQFSQFSGETCPSDPRRGSSLTAPFLPPAAYYKTY